MLLVAMACLVEHAAAAAACEPARACVSRLFFLQWCCWCPVLAWLRLHLESNDDMHKPHVNMQCSSATHHTPGQSPVLQPCSCSCLPWGVVAMLTAGWPSCTPQISHMAGHHTCTLALRAGGLGPCLWSFSAKLSLHRTKTAAV